MVAPTVTQVGKLSQAESIDEAFAQRDDMMNLIKQGYNKVIRPATQTLNGEPVVGTPKASEAAPKGDDASTGSAEKKPVTNFINGKELTDDQKKLMTDLESKSEKLGKGVEKTFEVLGA